MNYLYSMDIWAQGYFWGTILFPIEWYFAKPMLTRVYNDGIYYINPILAKFTTKQLPAYAN